MARSRGPRSESRKWRHSTGLPVDHCDVMGFYCGAFEVVADNRDEVRTHLAQSRRCEDITRLLTMPTIRETYDVARRMMPRKSP